jgi:hypothetical protein
MPAYDCRRALHRLTDETIDAAICLEKARRGWEAPKLESALHSVTSELSSWELDSLAAFARAPFVPLLCRDILAERDRSARRDWHERGLTIGDAYHAFRSEYQNLTKILNKQHGGDLERASKFCMALNMVGLRQWKHPRRGLAA